MKLRYTGATPVTFIQLGLEKQPGEEFDVHIDDAEGYLARDDVEAASVVAEDPPDEAPKVKTPRPVRAMTMEHFDTLPEAPAEVADAVPDDH